MGFLPGEIWKPQAIYSLLGPYNAEHPHVDKAQCKTVLHVTLFIFLCIGNAMSFRSFCWGVQCEQSTIE